MKLLQSNMHTVDCFISTEMEMKGLPYIFTYKDYFMRNYMYIIQKN